MNRRKVRELTGAGGHSWNGLSGGCVRREARAYDWQAGPDGASGLFTRYGIESSKTFCCSRPRKGQIRTTQREKNSQVKIDRKKGKKRKHDLKNLFFLVGCIRISRASPRCRPGNGQKKSPQRGGCPRIGRASERPLRGVMMCPETAEASPARLTDRQQDYIIKLSANAGEGRILTSSNR